MMRKQVQQGPQTLPSSSGSIVIWKKGLDRAKDSALAEGTSPFQLNPNPRISAMFIRSLLKSTEIPIDKC